MTPIIVVRVKNHVLVYLELVEVVGLHEGEPSPTRDEAELTSVRCRRTDPDQADRRLAAISSPCLQATSSVSHIGGRHSPEPRAEPRALRGREPIRAPCGQQVEGSLTHLVSPPPPPPQSSGLSLHRDVVHAGGPAEDSMTRQRTRSERLLHEAVGASVLPRYLGHSHLHTHIFAYANSYVRVENQGTQFGRIAPIAEADVPGGRHATKMQNGWPDRSANTYQRSSGSAW